MTPLRNAACLSCSDAGLKVFRCPEPARDTWVRVATDLVRRMSKEVEIDVAANAMKFRSVHHSIAFAPNVASRVVLSLVWLDLRRGVGSAYEHGPGYARCLW